MQLTPKDLPAHIDISGDGISTGGGGYKLDFKDLDKELRNRMKDHKELSIKGEDVLSQVTIVEDGIIFVYKEGVVK